MSFFNLSQILPPEFAHNSVVKLLKYSNPFITEQHYSNHQLSQKIFNSVFTNPIGLAAGFDKNAEILNPLAKLGFGFIEAGTVTPLMQHGNNKPRIFKNNNSKSIINSLGFNNNGLDNFLANLEKYRGSSLIGINIGPNSTVDNISDSIVEMIKKIGSRSCYIAINISSPNTKNLRLWSETKKFNSLLSAIANTRHNNNIKIPILIKLSPDIPPKQDQSIINVCKKYHINGLIISNSTITRPKYNSINMLDSKTVGKNNLDVFQKFCNNNGGMSGYYLSAISNNMIKRYYKALDGKIPIIGVGGILTPYDVLDKIKAGANLIEIYSGLIFYGHKIIKDSISVLEKEIAKYKLNNISELVGVDAK